MTEETIDAPAETPEHKVDIRGQMLVPLDGVDYLTRPDFEAIEAIEKKLNTTCFLLGGAALRGELKAFELGIIVAELMRGAGRNEEDLGPSYKNPDPKKLGRMIFEEGATRISARIAIVLIGAATGGYTATGEVRPVA